MWQNTGYLCSRKESCSEKKFFFLICPPNNVTNLIILFTPFTITCRTPKQYNVAGDFVFGATPTSATPTSIKKRKRDESSRVSPALEEGEDDDDSEWAIPVALNYGCLWEGQVLIRILGSSSNILSSVLK